MSTLYHRAGIGEILVELIIFHGAEINIFQHIADLVGLMGQLVHLLIELTLLEIEHGPI